MLHFILLNLCFPPLTCFSLSVLSVLAENCKNKWPSTKRNPFFHWIQAKVSFGKLPAGPVGGGLWRSEAQALEQAGGAVGAHSGRVLMEWGERRRLCTGVVQRPGAALSALVSPMCLEVSGLYPLVAEWTGN